MLTKRINLLFNKRIYRHMSAVHKVQLDTKEIINYITDSLTKKEQQMVQNPDYFKVHNIFNVKNLFDARVHYGHKMSSLNPKMKPFVFGHRLGYVIFDLDKTAHFLRQALNFTSHIAYRNGIILFVSKNPRATLLVENTALECKEYAVTRHWKPGCFTNAENFFKNSVRLPDLCIVFNVKLEDNAMHPSIIQAAAMGIPTVGIVDSNCDPSLITYPVPGNDDSYTCFEFYCKVFKEAILRAKNERKKDLMQSKTNLEDAVSETEKKLEEKTVDNK